jgi:hypothetical protein
MGEANCKNCRCNKDENDLEKHEINTSNENKTNKNNINEMNHNITPVNNIINDNLINNDKKILDNNNSNSNFQNTNILENINITNTNLNPEDNILTEEKIKVDINDDNINLKNINNSSKFNNIQNKTPLIIDDNCLDISNPENTKFNIKNSQMSLNISDINKSKTLSSNINKSNFKNKSTIYNKKIFTNKQKNNIIHKSNTQNNSLIFNDSFHKNIKKYEINKIDFGINEEEKNNLSINEKKALEEAQKNLNHFYPIEETEINNLEKKLSKISLRNILPLGEKNITDNDEIIFHSDLKKLINFKINSYTQMYSNRFCVVTSKSFIYYKSKEQLLRKLKPISVIPFESILRINLSKIKKDSNKLDHIIICNKMGFNKKRNSSILGSFSESVDINNNSNYINDNYESLLIFMDEDENLIYKWYLLLQYILIKVKEREDKKKLNL